MSNFFQGWRRQIAVPMLVMASVGMAGWVWSLEGSPKGTIPTKLSIEFVADGIHVSVSQYSDRILGYLKAGNKSTANYAVDVIVDLTIPYWSVVVPLTLLSAWLLLSKEATRSDEADGRK